MSTGGSLVHRAADVEEIVGDYAEPDPALHSIIGLVPAATESMSSFDDAECVPRIRCAISGHCGTSASSALVCVRDSWSSDWECRRRCIFPPPTRVKSRYTRLAG